MTTPNFNINNINPPRDINYTEAYSGIPRKTLRRWWELGKFPAPTLVGGKLYWLHSVLAKWKIETFGGEE